MVVVTQTSKGEGCQLVFAYTGEELGGIRSTIDKPLSFVVVGKDGDHLAK